MSIGKRIADRRKAMGLSQAQLAEALGVSFQTVSGWEREAYQPERHKLAQIAQALGATEAWLQGYEVHEEAADGAGRLFHEERMYTFVKAAATAKGLEQTLRALPFAREKHQGQLRKGEALIPYISHPLTMCCHALALGLDEDALLAALLLHDVVEDCGVTLAELPVEADARETVRLLSKDPDHEKDEEGYDRRYFAAIALHPHAMLVKLLDRCHNLSVMADGFKRTRMMEYAKHTREFVLPLADRLSAMAPGYSNACFLLKYQMKSLINTVERLLAP